MRRAVRWEALTASLAILAAVAGAGTYLHRTYFAHLGEIDRIVRQIPTHDAALPVDLPLLLESIHPNGWQFFVVRNLIVATHPERLRNLDWHFRNLVWAQLLPMKLSRTEMLGLYAHFMPFEQGRGIGCGSRHYYSKSPSALSRRELLELLVIAKSPRHYSPKRNPKALQAEVERISAKIRAPAA